VQVEILQVDRAISERQRVLENSYSALLKRVGEGNPSAGERNARGMAELRR